LKSLALNWQSPSTLQSTKTLKAINPAPHQVDKAPLMKMKTIREEYKLPIRRIFLLWLPFVFMVILSAITLAPNFLKVGNGIPSSLVVLVCFLPLAFFLVANASFNEFSGLEARIRKLEKEKA